MGIAREMFGLYRVTRVGDEVEVAKELDIHHRDMFSQMTGTSNDAVEIDKKLAKNPNNYDMALAMRGPEGILISGRSTEFNFPPDETMPLVRPKTMNKLREKYPEETFLEDRG